MKKYDAVIFDLDGTLLDTLEDLTAAVNFTMETYGYHKYSTEEIRKVVGNGIRKLMMDVTPKGEENPKFEEIFDCFKKYYGEHCNDKTKPYDGVLEVMERIKKEGYKIAIVSNKIHSAVLELNELYFKAYTDTVCGDMEGLKRKPAPDSCYKVLEEMGISKERAVYVGDSEVDLETAKNAGLPCISVLWGFRDRDMLEKLGANMFAIKSNDILKYL